MIYMVPHLLEQVTMKYPFQPAVVCGDRVLSYCELNDEVNRLAWVLQDCGVARGDRVGLILHKSVEAISAIYAILKVGAVYVPLDPHWPLKRITYVLQDCDIRVVVAEQNALHAVKEALHLGAPIQTILLREHTVPEDVVFLSPRICWRSWADIRTANSAPFPIRGIEDDLAYIMYTSGSTGKPKGVAIPHRAVLGWITWGAHVASLGPNDRIGSQVPLHFDISAFDIFVASRTGAALNLVPEELLRLPVSLAQFLEEQVITFIYWVPSTLIQVLLYGGLEQRNLQHLRIVFFAGEIFPTKYLRKWMAAAPEAQFYNLYGLTEAPACTYYHISSPPSTNQPVPIGRACENMEIIAISEAGNLIQPGEVGQLLVQGFSVMKGYWKMHQVTQAVLLQNPFQTYFPDFFLCTGDLVTMDDNGNYVYVGRKDAQIKSRGYRIDLNEIEVVLLEHPEVLEAAAVAVPHSEIEHKIKAFVIRSSETLSEQILIEHCRNLLPKYMLPSSITFVTTLPKTSTGKVDRQLLLILDQQNRR